MQLNEMVVMVTGAASGMGRQFALSLARDGAKVFATDLNEEGLASLSEAAKDLAGEVATGVGNVAKESDVIGMVNGCIEAFGTINGLINNAGIFRDGLLVKKDRETGKVEANDSRPMANGHRCGLDRSISVHTGSCSCHDRKQRQRGSHCQYQLVARHGNMGQTNYSAAKARLQIPSCGARNWLATESALGL